MKIKRRNINLFIMLMIVFSIIKVALPEQATLHALSSYSYQVAQISPTPSTSMASPAATAGYNRIDLSWGSVPSATSYRVYRRSSEATFVEIVRVGVTTYTDTAVVPHTTYYYYIVAENSTGTSAPSEIVSATTLTAPPETLPLKISNIVIQRNATEAILSWQTNHSAAGILEYGPTLNYGTKLSFNESTSQEAVLVNLKPITEYYYKILAIDTLGKRAEYTNTFTTLASTTPMKREVPSPSTPNIHNTSSGIPSTTTQPTSGTKTASSIQNITSLNRPVFSGLEENIGIITTRFIREVVAPVTAGLAVLGLTLQVPFLNIVALLRLVFLQPILLVGRRKRYAWGEVYNSLNKLPVDLAIVRLIHTTSHQVVQTRVTGKSGRFFFKVSPGNYRLEVIKDPLLFPSKLLSKVTHDGRRTDLYHGEALTIREQDPLIAVPVPLDPKVEEKTLARLWWEKVGRLMQIVLACLGSGVTLYSIVLTPQTLYLWILLLVHLSVLVLFLRLALPKRPRGWGVVRDASTKLPLSKVVAKLYNTAHDRLVDYELTDHQGRYAFLAGDSTYQLRFEKPGYQAKTSSEIDIRGKKEVNVVVDTGLKPKA